MQTVYKTSTYALIHMSVAFFIAWLVSGSLAIAIGISLLEPAFQIGAYYFHEKVWEKFGKRGGDHHGQKNVSCIAPCCAPIILNKIKELKDKKEAA